MIAVIQRVRDASVSVSGTEKGRISHGMLVYYSVEADDSIDMIEPFLDKLIKLRIFEDENGKMNLDLSKVGGEILFISQFTIAANLDRGNRPDFANAKNPEEAEAFYARALSILRGWGIRTECGVFGAHMMVSYTNDGPVTFVLDSSKLGRFRKNREKSDKT